MFTETNASAIYNMADKVVVDGTKLSAEEAYGLICPGGVLKRQLIKFRTNKEEGRIYKIYRYSCGFFGKYRELWDTVSRNKRYNKHGLE